MANTLCIAAITISRPSSINCHVNVFKPSAWNSEFWFSRSLLLPFSQQTSPARICIFVSRGKILRAWGRKWRVPASLDSPETVIDSLRIFFVNAEPNKSVYKWWTWVAFTTARVDACVCVCARSKLKFTRTHRPWGSAPHLLCYTVRCEVHSREAADQWLCLRTVKTVSSIIHSCSMIMPRHLHRVLSLNVRWYLPTRWIQEPSEMIASASLATSPGLLWLLSI